VVRTTLLHRKMSSFHEGKAIIEEELDELWDEVKKKRPSKKALRNEAVQLAAMAVRFILDTLD
jgi:hypothetical protein